MYISLRHRACVWIGSKGTQGTGWRREQNFWEECRNISERIWRKPGGASLVVVPSEKIGQVTATLLLYCEYCGNQLLEDIRQRSDLVTFCFKNCLWGTLGKQALNFERGLLQVSRWKMSLLAVGVERRDKFETYTERGIKIDLVMLSMIINL